MDAPVYGEFAALSTIIKPTLIYWCAMCGKWFN
jgi:hypothetical protein